MEKDPINQIESFPIEIDLKKSLSQTKLIIEGIEIYFPYNPYPSQEEYMKKIILTLKNKGNISALESPTGTGKTLCLLCSVLGWIKYNKKENIKIYYCTRTVSQINNIMKELNKTCYILKTSFLTSKKFSCVKISKEERDIYDISKINDLCEMYRDKCKYYKESGKYDFSKYDNLEDIEDLFKEGKKFGFCPYYYNLNKTQLNANITFMSYNYILNPFIRNKLKDYLHSNSIIILDEAHNICNVFESLYSNKIKKKDLEKIQTLLQLLLDYNNSKENENQILNENNDMNLLFQLKANEINSEINNLKKFISNINALIPKDNNSCIQIEDGIINKNLYLCSKEFFGEIFKNFSLKFYTFLNNIVNKLESDEIKRLKEFYEKGINIKQFSFKSLIKKPNKFYEFLSQLLLLLKKDTISFKFIFSNQEENENSRKLSETKEGKFFEIYCVDPSYGMKELLSFHPYSIILTSGTLSINILETLLHVNFKETLRNNHVVKNNQFLANIISSFKVKNFKIDFSFLYKNRENKLQMLFLGNEIYNLAKSVKFGGILVFFQSYIYLSKCFNIWLENKIIKKFKSIKKTIFDFKNYKDRNEKMINDGKKGKNLLLFTVYRGKNSEGINFPDDEARMVICVGMPYPNLSDIKVKLKKDFLDEKYRKEKRGLKGWEWYREEAMVAINQSLGRLIRNKDDYGIMICIGNEIEKNRFLFSKWIQNNISSIELNDNIQDYHAKIEGFLDNLKKNEINLDNKYNIDLKKNIEIKDNIILNSENEHNNNEESEDKE